MSLPAKPPTKKLMQLRLDGEEPDGYIGEGFTWKRTRSTRHAGSKEAPDVCAYAIAKCRAHAK